MLIWWFERFEINSYLKAIHPIMFWFRYPPSLWLNQMKSINFLNRGTPRCQTKTKTIFSRLLFARFLLFDIWHSYTECQISNTVQYEIYCMALSQSNFLNQPHHLISSCYHMVKSAIWDLFFEIFNIARARRASVILEIEKNKSHIARVSMW